jgi:hypothetical protein
MEDYKASSSYSFTADVGGYRGGYPGGFRQVRPIPVPAPLPGRYSMVPNLERTYTMDRMMEDIRQGPEYYQDLSVIGTDMYLRHCTDSFLRQMRIVDKKDNYYIHDPVMARHRMAYKTIGDLEMRHKYNWLDKKRDDLDAQIERGLAEHLAAYYTSALDSESALR